MNRYLKWQTGIVLVFCGLVVCMSYYLLAEIKENRKFRVMSDDAATKTKTGVTNQNNRAVHHVQSAIRQTNEDWTYLKPPMISLTYGYIEPTFNPAIIRTALGHKCTTTIDPANMHRSDAVVIRFDRAFEQNQFTKPKYRRQDQMYVFLSLEPSWPFYNHDFSFVDKGFFNWTMTYRRDSDIYFPYFTMPTLIDDDRQSRRFYGQNAVEQVLSKKTSQFTALVAIGRCEGGDGPVNRLKYVQAMEKSGLRIEKRGGCYNNKFRRPWNSNIFRYYAGTFKFFLAFENGYHCRDYVTEKVWNNSLKSGTVPVIWGAPKGDIEKILPPGSYIHTDDYESPKQLVDYLNYLNSNATAYSEYFNWRRRAPDQVAWNRKRATGYEMLCDKLCEMKKFGNVSKIYHSFKDWYINQDNPECFKITETNW